MEICVGMLGMLAYTLRSMQYHKYDRIRVCFGSSWKHSCQAVILGLESRARSFVLLGMRC